LQFAEGIKEPWSQNITFKENDLGCNPTGFYSITKRCAEQMLICFCETFDIKYRIFRLSNVLGVGDKKISKKKNAFQYMVKEIVNNRDIELYYDGNVIRDFIHVDDVCTGIKTCLDNAKYNEIINIGSGVPTLIVDLLKTTHALSNSTAELKFINPTKFHNIVQTRNSYLDITKLKKYGFETYSPWINESYDDIQDSKCRLQAIVHEMQRISQLSIDQQQHIIDCCRLIAKRNQKRFFDPDFFNTIVDELKENVSLAWKKHQGRLSPEFYWKSLRWRRKNKPEYFTPEVRENLSKTLPLIRKLRRRST
jgi:hypothetical protein